MGNNVFQGLFRQVSKLSTKTLVVANGVDTHTLEAIEKAVKLNLIYPIITGERDKIHENASLVGLAQSDYTVVNADSDLDAVNSAVNLVREKRADLIMKGLISTDLYMKALLNKSSGILSEGALLTHLTLMQSPAYHKPLLFSDVAIIPLPNKEQKAIITDYLISAARKFGVEKPKIAFIAATEKVIPKIQACADAAYLKEQWEAGRFPEAICDGPMGIDLAIDKEAVRVKGYESPVAADADCLVFPNFESGNIFYKICTRWANCEVGAIVVGTNAPAVLSSRGDSAKTKLNSIALAALNA